MGKGLGIVRYFYTEQRQLDEDNVDKLEFFGEWMNGDSEGSDRAFKELANML